MMYQTMKFIKELGIITYLQVAMQVAHLQQWLLIESVIVDGEIWERNNLKCLKTGLIIIRVSIL